MLDYQHRVCKCGCGKRIPRWTDGKLTPKSRVFFAAGCSAYYRKLHPVKRPGGSVPAPTTENAILRPISRAFPEPVSSTSGAVSARQQFAPCPVCGRVQLEGRYCNDRCRDYVPLGPTHEIGPTDFPVNVLGGYRFPGAPKVAL